VRGIQVCAKHRRSRYQPEVCAYVRHIAPGGNVTVHFNQLVVANVITIEQSAVIILCEVDVLGTKVILSPEGQHLSYDASNFIDNIPVSFLCRP